MRLGKLITVISAAFLLLSVCSAPSSAAGPLVAEVTTLVPKQNSDGTAYRLTVTFNAYVTKCNSIIKIGFRVDSETASFDSIRMTIPSQKKGVFSETLDVQIGTWTEGTHSIIPVAYDSCWNLYSDINTDVKSTFVEVPAFIKVALASPANGAIANKTFDLKIEVTGPQAKTITAAALDTDGTWANYPIFIGVDKRKDDPSAANLFVAQHQNAVAFWLNPATTFAWRVDPTGWSVGTRTLRVTVLDLAGREYRTSTQIVVPAPTTANLCASPSSPSATECFTGVTKFTGLGKFEVRTSIAPGTGYTIKKIAIKGTYLPAGNVDGLKRPILKANFPATFELGSEYLTWTLPDGLTPNSFSFQVDTSSWSDGFHTLEGLITDSSGATARTNQLICNTSNFRPSVSIVEIPQNDLLQTQALRVSGVVASSNSAQIDGFRVTLNGRPLSDYSGVKANFTTTITGPNFSVPNAANSEPSWTIDASRWDEGDYTLLVYATDTNGRNSPVEKAQFSLFNGKIQAEKRLVYDQILAELNRSGDGYNDRYTKIQDTIQGIKDKAEEALSLIKSVSVSSIGTSNFTNTVSARTKQIELQENSTTKDKGYKFLQPFATNCAQADSTSRQLATDLSTISARISDLYSKNQTINSLSSQLGNIRNDINQNVKDLPELPFPVNTPNNWTKLTVAQLTTYLTEIRAANTALLSIQKKAVEQRIPDSVMSTIKSKIDDAKSAMSEARVIEAELNANLSNDTGFKALLAKEANYLQGCISKQKFKTKGSPQPAIKVAAPSGKQVSINCTNGIKTTKITGVAPTCPPGYRRS